MVIIVDYGIGNIFSVTQVLTHLSANYKLSSQKEDIAFATKIILPGVGAFKPAMEKLTYTGLDKSIKIAAKNGAYILGICLGMQLLASYSYEDGKHNGLDLIKGAILPLKNKVITAKIPHVGFNSVKNTSNIAILPEQNESDFYFTHSYYFTNLENCKTALTLYEIEFVSAFQKGNLFGVQFHPEKSQSNGINLIKKFIEL